MIAAVNRFWMPAAASVALVYLVIMLVTGALPERRQLVQSEAHGVLQLAPESITRVTVVADAPPAVFVRQANGWLREGSAAAVDAELAEIIERAVKFMHTANPVRALAREEIADAGLAEFGLEHPRLRITLEDAGGVALEADFGNDSADGLLQYMRLRNRDDLYLMSGFVGKEWETVANGGHSDEAQATRSLVSLPMDDVAAVEIFARDKSYRFERDATGAWLLHRHAAGDDPNTPHRADPAQSERITQALAMFARTPIERSIARGERVDAYGLADPETIIVLFTEDEARPPLSFTVGELASDGLGRYLLMPDGREIVTIPNVQLTNFIDLAEALEP
jgi:Domain of unknown function (DUF4340)